MNEEQFNKFLEGELSRIREVMTIKSTYRTPENVFHNFDTGATIENKSREEIIWGMAIKHFISIQDIRRGLKEGKLPSKETLDEKYTDLINYLLLEKASIESKIEEKNDIEFIRSIVKGVMNGNQCESDKFNPSETLKEAYAGWHGWHEWENPPRKDNPLDKVKIINQTEKQ